MTSLTVQPAELPTKDRPVPISANELLLRSLTKGGLLTTRIFDLGEFTKDDLPALYSLKAELGQMDGPAKPAEIVVELEKLFSHYPQQELPENALKSRWRDWLTDLAGAPLDAVRAACRDWRRSAERFAPTPGQLIEKLEVYTRPRKTALSLTERAILCLETGRPH
jgi:hypothetical protein